MNTLNIKAGSTESLVELIQLYLKLVHEYSTELLMVLSINDLTEWRGMEVPQKGNFNNSEWSYAFHGSGCFISSQEYDVDFEFDKHCNVGGFDVWRLWSFVEDNEELYSSFTDFKDRKYLEEVFSLLKNKGVIAKRNGNQESDLYFLND